MTAPETDHPLTGLGAEQLRAHAAEHLLRARDRSPLTDAVDDDDLVRQHSP